MNPITPIEVFQHTNKEFFIGVVPVLNELIEENADKAGNATFPVNDYSFSNIWNLEELIQRYYDQWDFRASYKYSDKDKERYFSFSPKRVIDIAAELQSLYDRISDIERQIDKM